MAPCRAASLQSGQVKDALPYDLPSPAPLFPAEAAASPQPSAAADYAPPGSPTAINGIGGNAKVDSHDGGTSGIARDSSADPMSLGTPPPPDPPIVEVDASEVTLLQWEDVVRCTVPKLAPDASPAAGKPVAATAAAAAAVARRSSAASQVASSNLFRAVHPFQSYRSYCRL